MSSSNSSPPRAVIYTCAGPSLSAAERDFFADADPLGFILFDEQCESPEQIRDLVAAFRDAVGRADAPVLIDQEGGRVARLKPPQWRAAPPAARFGELAGRDLEKGLAAARLNARLLALELADLGINVDCAPVLDVPIPGSHDVIGDRAYSHDPAMVARLGRASCDGFLEGGVIPVLKHMPGHGRAMVDSHKGLPLVDTPRAELEATDFVPFRALADAPWAMSAHVLYSAVDAEAPATTSRRVIEEVIRGTIGFQGVLLSDDIGMEALSGGPADRARALLAAGCDTVLHCVGKLDEMKSVAADIPLLSADAAARVGRGEAMRRSAALPGDADFAALAAELDAMLESA